MRVSNRQLPSAPTPCTNPCVYSVNWICDQPQINKRNGDAYCHRLNNRDVMAWLRPHDGKGRRECDGEPMSNNYEQLCGALGVLKSAGADLRWHDLLDELRQLAAAGDDPLKLHESAAPMLQKYRDMCVDRGLIRAGDSFTTSDAESLART